MAFQSVNISQNKIKSNHFFIEGLHIVTTFARYFKNLIHHLPMENRNTLAKVALAINVVLIILVIVLFMRTGNNSAVTEANTSEAGNDSTMANHSPTATTGKYAFFNMDSLSGQLLLYAEIEKEIQAANQDAEQKMRNKQRDIDNWKKKWEKKGALLSSEEAKYREEAEKIQMEAMQFEQNVQIKLQQDQEKFMQTLAMRISNFTGDYAKQNGYDAIFAYQMGQSLWYYNRALDITGELVKEMNADFEDSTVDSEEGE